MKARPGQVFHHSELELIVSFTAPTLARRQMQIKAAALAPLKMLGSGATAPQPWYNAITQMLKTSFIYISRLVLNSKASNHSLIGLVCFILMQSFCSPVLFSLPIFCLFTRYA